MALLFSGSLIVIAAAVVLGLLGRHHLLCRQLRLVRGSSSCPGCSRSMKPAAASRSGRASVPSSVS